MPTDLEALERLLIQFGVAFYTDPTDKRRIICETGNTKVDGYAGYSVTFVFDKDNRFIKMIIGE